VDTITPWSRLLLEKVVVPEPVRFPALSNPKFLRRVNKIPPNAPALNQINPVQAPDPIS